KACPDSRGAELTMSVPDGRIGTVCGRRTTHGCGPRGPNLPDENDVTDAVGEIRVIVIVGAVEGLAMTDSPARSPMPEGTEVARNAWGIILRYEEWRTLELRWLPTQMSDSAFKKTLELLADLGERYRPQFMVIDAVEFHHELGEGVMQWREANIVPR